MKFHGRDLRTDRHSAGGQIYHVTTTTRNRQSIFVDFYSARLLIRTLRYAHQQEWVESLSFVVMPDHLHWLFVLGNQKSLAEVVASVKNYSSMQNPGLKWQAGFHDRAIRKEEDLLAIARYIVANPLRANLVTSIREYPHWDAKWV